MNVRISQSAFPNHTDTPSGLEQHEFVATIPLFVGTKLGLPELAARRGIRCQAAAFVPMPEAAADLDNSSPARKHDIGTAGKRPVVESKPEASPVQRSSQSHFGLRVYRSYARHHCRSGRTIYNVGHVFPWMKSTYLVRPIPMRITFFEA